ncbi:hypothetical protein RGAI101_3095 [Roseobacter sp. GAI101]|nr:hypothetical protein RGAI101_3095 [Roseobacter sp. GAI101]
MVHLGHKEKQVAQAAIPTVTSSARPFEVFLGGNLCAECLTASCWAPLNGKVSSALA